MNDSIKVSIVVPIYNVERFLHKCIESIQKQSHKNIEIILVDDGSPDNSGKICDEYSANDERIIVIHKENGGVSAARNSGLDIASGDYVCFVDGDDYVANDYVEYLLMLCKKYSSEIALSSSFFTNYNDKQVCIMTEAIWTGEDAVEAILCNRVAIGCYNKIFSKKIIENVRFIDGLPIGEGFNFNIEAFQYAEKVATGNRRVYFYRKDNTNSVMSNFNLYKYEEGLRAIQLIKNKLVFHNNRIGIAWEYANWRTHSDFYDMIVLSKAVSIHPEFYNRVYRKTKKDALIALKVPCSKQDKIRALIMKVCPSIIPKLMDYRNRKYLIKN